MRVVLPPATAGMGLILDTIRRAFLPALSQDEAAPRVLLLAPDGSVYAVTVSNTGTLSATLFTGNT